MFHRRDDGRRHRPPDEQRRHERRPRSQHGGYREDQAPRRAPAHHRELPMRGGPPRHGQVPRGGSAVQRPGPPPGPRTTAGDAATFHQPNENSTLTAAEHSASDASSAGAPEEAACLVCIRVARRRVTLACGHAWCRRCLRTQVRTALQGGDGAWPPRCCAGEQGEIGEGVVEWLGDPGVVGMYRRRSAEMDVAAGERVYCHLITCATFIPPTHQITSGPRGRGGRIAVCQQAGCSRQTCVDCGTAAHRGRECPRDPDMEAVLQTIEAHGYQFCAQCNAVVERIDGCNHITCRCGYQFCYMCGVRWKRCQCELYGGARIQRQDRPRLEEAVREQIAAPQPRGAAAADAVTQQPPAPVRVPRPAPAPGQAYLRDQQHQDQRLGLLAPADDETRRRWEREDAEARRQAEQLRLWAWEEGEAVPFPEPAPAQALALAPAPAPAPGPAPAPAPGERRAPARARPPVVRRAPSPPAVRRAARDDSPERPRGNGGRIDEERLPYPEAAYLIPPGIGMRELEDHMYNPGIQREARQLQERARYEQAMRFRAQQEQMLGLGGGGYPPGATVLPPTVLPGGTVRYQYNFGAPPGGAQGFDGYPPGMDYGVQLVPGQYPPGMDVRWLMYQAALGGNMTGGYYMQF